MTTVKVHEQADQNRIHDILRVFDTTYAYGPCGLGMTRLERWERAQALGLSPPEGVSPILESCFNLNLPERDLVNRSEKSF